MTGIRHRTAAAVLLGGVVVAGALLRLDGFGRDLPFAYNPDETANLRPVLDYLLRGDLNPHRFYHPGSPLMYLAAAGLEGYRRLAGGPGREAFIASFDCDPAPFWLLARGVSLLAGLGAIAAVFGIARGFSGVRAGLAAALFFALAPMPVKYSRVFRTDSLGVLLVLLAVFASLALLRRSRGWGAAAGVLAGLAAATKYTSAAVLPAALAAALLRETTALGRSRLPAAAAVLAGFFAGFFLGAPYVVLDWSSAAAAFRVQSSSYYLQYPPVSAARAAALYLGETVPYGAGGLAVAAAALAGAVAAWRRSRRRLTVLLVFPVLYLLALVPAALRNPRYMVYVVPFVAVLAGVGTARAGEILGRSRGGTAAVTVLLTALVGIFPLAQTLRDRTQTVGEDARTAARRYLEETVPPGEGIAYEFGCPPLDQLDRGRWRLLDMKCNRIVWRPLEFYERRGFRYLIVNGFYKPMVLERPERWPEAARRYRELERRPRVASFESGQNRIDVYRIF
ncbi:MAG TPA: glycosyltransferase family 39 protein [bacterium]|nr:glycosyltransferase family 39 protein [bacterium]